MIVTKHLITLNKLQLENQGFDYILRVLENILHYKCI